MPYLVLCLLLFSLCCSGSDLASRYDSIYQIYKQDNFNEAKAEALKLIPLAIEKKSSLYQVKLYYLLGYLAYHTDDRRNSVIYYLDGAYVAERSTSIEIKNMLISIYKNLASNLGEFNHYDLSHKFINRALNVASEIENKDQIISLLSNRVSELLNEGRYLDALNQVDSLTGIYELDSISLLKIKNNAAIALRNLGYTEMAKKNYLYILKHGPTYAPDIYTRALQNIGNIYLQNGNSKEALTYYHEEVEMAQRYKLDQLLFQAYEHIGRTYASIENYPVAISYFLKAVAIDNTGDMSPSNYPIYQTLSEAYEAINKLDSAFFYKDIYTRKLERFIESQDHILQINQKNKIRLMADKYLHSLEIYEKDKEHQKIITVSSSMLIGLLAVILGVYYRKRLNHSYRSLNV